MTDTLQDNEFSCMAVLALLDRYMEGELSESELRGVRRHVAGCSKCAKFGDRYAKTIEALRAHGDESVPDAVASRVLAQLRQVE